MRSHVKSIRMPTKTNGCPHYLSESALFGYLFLRVLRANHSATQCDIIGDIGPQSWSTADWPGVDKRESTTMKAIR